MHDKKERQTRHLEIQLRKIIHNRNHVIITPENENWEKERNLKKVATEGVVLLFNAVRKYQRSQVSEEEEKKNTEVENLSKEDFIDLLKSTPAPKLVREKVKKQKESKSAQSQWGVLSDDYLLNAKAKDWEEEEEEKEIEREVEYA
eukprot:TRINITY_DN4477_c0_g1_i5.p1 TRINITY_DN4477_c0_g1~~TRINITY_DN4477_c0_g1_i5.p1  ORF type:complete len:146 (+),score=52.67 TRINITY_DN4477_c0_g1_i5:348-785(+)